MKDLKKFSKRQLIRIIERQEESLIDSVKMHETAMKESFGKDSFHVNMNKYVVLDVLRVHFDIIKDTQL